MAYILQKKMGIFCIFCLSCMWLISPVAAKTGSEVNLTLTLQKRPFSEVVDLVSREIGYIIKFEEGLRDISVSGRFVNVPVEYFFHRILKGRNVIIDINDKNKEIIVRNFGSKENELLVANNLKGGVPSHGLVDPVTGKSMEEMDKIYALQEQNREERLNDPDSIDPMTGKKLSVVKEIFKKQEENYRKIQTSPDAIDPVTGKRIVEINQIIKTQEAKRVARISDPKAVDPMTGKTMAELNEIYALQEQKRIERLNNPDSIDPMTGKTMAELNSLLQQQEENRKKR